MYGVLSAMGLLLLINGALIGLLLWGLRSARAKS